MTALLILWAFILLGFGVIIPLVKWWDWKQNNRNKMDKWY